MNDKLISKPDANPILALFLTLFVAHTGHVHNGQITKWPVVSLAFVIGYFLCALPGIFILVLSVIDTYQTAVRLQSGESIHENEYSLPLLYYIVRTIDKSATCSRVS